MGPRQRRDLADADSGGPFHGDEEPLALLEGLTLEPHWSAQSRAVAGDRDHHQIIQPIAKEKP